MSDDDKPQFWTTLFRSVRLRCPKCGRGKLFCGWFTMHEACEDCALPLHRTGGFYIGSVYINYGITSLLLLGIFLGLWLGLSVEANTSLYIAAGVVVPFALWFFRYARSLWLGMDHFFDPDGDKR